MSQFGNLLMRGKKGEEGIKVEKLAQKENIDHQEKLRKIREAAYLSEQRILRENEEKERQARIKREKVENQFKETFVQFQKYIHPEGFSMTKLSLTQMEEKMRNDVEQVKYDLMRRLNQLSYGQILFDQRSQLRDDLQKLSASLYHEIHPIFLQRPTHKRFDFVNQYPVLLQHIIEAEGREKRELRVS